MVTMKTTFKLTPVEVERAVREYVERRHPGSKVLVQRFDCQVRTHFGGILSFSTVRRAVFDGVSGELSVPEDYSGD